LRNISLSLAALALVLAGSLTSVAHATFIERQFVDQRADRESTQTTYAHVQAKSTATVDGATAWESFN
jgi:hypothetical protein